MTPEWEKDFQHICTATSVENVDNKEINKTIQDLNEQYDDSTVAVEMGDTLVILVNLSNGVTKTIVTKDYWIHTNEKGAHNDRKKEGTA